MATNSLEATGAFGAIGVAGVGVGAAVGVGVGAGVGFRRGHGGAHDSLHVGLGQRFRLVGGGLSQSRADGCRHVFLVDAFGGGGGHGAIHHCLNLGAGDAFRCALAHRVLDEGANLIFGEGRLHLGHCVK